MASDILGPAQVTLSGQDAQTGFYKQELYSMLPHLEKLLFYNW
jgi:hypothetical protein